MKQQEIVKQLYFNEKYNQTKIAKKLNVSNKYVSKVLNDDSRYQEEKEKRKVISKNKHKEKTINYIKAKRKKVQDKIGYDQLKQMHIQASNELSGGRKTISNRAFRDWNSSAYRYDKKSKSYVLKKDITAGYDAPKRISWK
jgi:transcriptional regulator with XRE-family HTH domain